MEPAAAAVSRRGCRDPLLSPSPAAPPELYPHIWDVASQGNSKPKKPCWGCAGSPASTWRGSSPLKVQCEVGETNLPVGFKGCGVQGLWGSLSCPGPYLFLFCSLWISLVCSSSCFSSLLVDREFSWSCISMRHV